jgi:hypothetical protein
MLTLIIVESVSFTSCHSGSFSAKTEYQKTPTRKVQPGRLAPPHHATPRSAPPSPATPRLAPPRSALPHLAPLCSAERPALRPGRLGPPPRAATGRPGPPRPAPLCAAPPRPASLCSA